MSGMPFPHISIYQHSCKQKVCVSVKPFASAQIKESKTTTIKNKP
jgi:hypothetical protein